ncbi:VCBS repeat-containing protein, partial [Desulfosarcina sp. OttesenSCG-928-A07]|nr:VCBS repeat-containing protein [Desulfosarcina sp. OttesenSCG-928-A07]
MKLPPTASTCFFCFVVLFLSFFSPCSAMAADTSTARVLVLPLTIHSEKEVPFLNRGILDMMTSRISQTATVIHQADAKSKKTPIQQGQAARADYVVSGSVTLFDNSVSTDAALVQVRTGQTVVRLNQLGENAGNVLVHVNQFATQVNQYLMGPTAAGAGAATTAPVAAVPVIAMDAAAQSPAVPMVSPYAAASEPSPVPVSETALKTEKLWTSPPVKGAIHSLAVADVTGDNRPNIIFLNDKQVIVATKNSARLDRVASFDLGSNHTVVSIDAGDFNGNQRAEIFVTRLTPNHQLDSMVLEWNGSALAPVATGQPWYFRVIQAPQKGPTLLGQRRGVQTHLDTGTLYRETFFLPGIFELTAQGDGYTAGSRIPVPNTHNIYQVAVGPVFNDGTLRAIAYSDSDMLKVYDSSGILHWSDDEALGGNPFFLLTPSLTDSRTQDRFYLSQRLFPIDLDGDGTLEVVTVHNRDLTRGMVERFRKYTRGRIVAVKWSGVGLK